MTSYKDIGPVKSTATAVPLHLLLEPAKPGATVENGPVKQTQMISVGSVSESIHARFGKRLT